MSDIEIGFLAGVIICFGLVALGIWVSCDIYGRDEGPRQ